MLKAFRIKRKDGQTLVGAHTKDVLIFLFFVFISAIFWFIQRLEEEFSKEVIVPVKLINVPEGVIITTDVPHEIRATLHAKGAEILPYLLFNKQVDTLFVNFRLFDCSEETGRATLVPNQVQRYIKDLIPSNANIISFAPDTISFHYNRGVYRRLPVMAMGVLTAQEQYSITGTHLYPDSVDVYAPSQVLDTLQAVYTQKFTLEGLVKTSDHSVAITQPRGIRTFPDSVTLRAEVDIMTRQRVEVPIVGVNFPAEKTLRTFPSTVVLTYLAPAGQQKNINTSEFTVIVAYADLINNQTNRCRPRVNNTPSGVTGVLIDPIEVDYLLENVQTEPAEPTTPPAAKKKRTGKR